MENTTETPGGVYKPSPIDALYFIVPLILICCYFFRGSVSGNNSDCLTRKKRRPETEIDHV